ncbi:MAG TPA: hypothetical protein VNG69_08770 [Casimicrobiaceae bacterium]|nr:hypothetical protein [Casimicrobiaceae bacterium]
MSMLLPNESIDSRPRIPVGVIDWPDASKDRPPVIEHVEFLLFGAVTSIFLAACAFAFVNVGTTIAEAKSVNALAGKVPVVETRILSIEMVEPAAPTVADHAREPRS